jgi:hypothetical protein
MAVFAVDTEDGPCVECVWSGQVVGSADLAAETDRWPRYSAAAELAGCPAAAEAAKLVPPLLLTWKVPFE